MEKIDRRRTYYIVFDTETTNGLDDPIVYDIGGAVVDRTGKVYDTFSFVVFETFCRMRELMKTAYYADKIPRYEEQIKNGKRTIHTWYYIKRYIEELTAKYDVKYFVAHNARFDYKSTATTQRYLTKSKYRYFLPFGTILYDTLKMAQDTICKQKLYIEWAHKNGYIRTDGKVRATAEILYKYITNNMNFEESHTGLEDVLIEKEILAKCLAQHKPMRKTAFN